MMTLSRRTVQDRNRLLGRLGGLLFFGSGLLTVATLPLPADPGINRPAIVLITIIAMTTGIAAWVAPWHRWPRSASLWLVPVAFGLIAAGNYYGAESDPRAYGIFFVVVFVWIGFGHARWTSVAFAPLATVAYMLPIIGQGNPQALAWTSAALAIPVSVLLGEALAWGTAQLEQAQQQLQAERDTAQRLRALDDLRTTFMTAVSHELRTPITICRGHLEVLGERPRPEELTDTIGVIVDELTRMGRIVDDITTLVRVEDPAYLRLERIHLVRFVPEVAAKAAPLLGDRLRVASPPSEATVSADPQRLTQALLNLLHNAAVHTNGGSGVDFRVVADRAAWRFEVADHGGGVPVGQELDLFQPFRRGSSAAPGTGLGLAIVRGIAEAHGGSAGLMNRPGTGATFWMEIPA